MKDKSFKQRVFCFSAEKQAWNFGCAKTSQNIAARVKGMAISMKVTVKKKDACCEKTAKKVLVEYLYLDLKTCDRCIGTDTVLDEVMEKITPTLELAGYAVDYRKTLMATAEIAAAHRFLSSPTIRVNGRDISQAVKENDCGCCGRISGTATDCRVFEYEGQSYEVPPASMLAEAVLKGVFAPVEKSAIKEYALPKNLKNFFSGKATKQSFDCSKGCC